MKSRSFDSPERISAALIPLKPSNIRLSSLCLISHYILIVSDDSELLMIHEISGVTAGRLCVIAILEKLKTQ